MSTNKGAERRENSPSVFLSCVFVVGVLSFSAFLLGVDYFNEIVRDGERINASVGNVQNYYQRRADLVPGFVEVVKGYAAHEKDTLVAVTEARAKATQTKIDPANITSNALADFEQGQTQFTSVLSRLLVIAENYPELKADKHFSDLQQQLIETENGIAIQRTKYNEATQVYNGKIKSFPGLLFARYAAWKPYPYFMAEDSAQRAPRVGFPKP